MTTTAAHRPTALDLSGIGSRTSREGVRRALAEVGGEWSDEQGFWDRLIDRRCGAIESPLMVFADLSTCARAFESAGRRAWADAFRSRHPYVIAFVRTPRDRRHAALVDDLMVASYGRMMVFDMTRNWQRSLRNCVARVLAVASPESIVSAQYDSDNALLWLHFGDGLTTTLEWSALALADHSLVRETVVPADDFASVEVLREDGTVFDIDSAVLRSKVERARAARLARDARDSDLALGTRLRKKRKAAGLTQQTLADRSGLEQSLISKLERAKHRPRYDTLERYARALGLAVAELLN